MRERERESVGESESLESLDYYEAKSCEAVSKFVNAKDKRD